MPNEAARPWKMLLPLAGVLMIAVAWSVYWYIAIGIAKERFADERKKLADRGITLDCTSETWGGFPFRFEFSCVSPAMKLENEAEAKASHLLAVALAYNPWQVVLLLDGPTTVAAGNVLPVSANHERIIASVTLGDNDAPSLSADVPKLDIPGLMTADRILIHTRPETDGRTGIAASVSKLNYQLSDNPPLAIDEGSLAGSLRQDDLTARIDKIELAYGAVRYWGSGDISLDQNRRLAGTLATETNDLDGLLAILEPHLEMTDQEKAGLRTVLGLLGNEAKADIIAKDGHLFLGPFKIADLLPIY